MSRRSLSTCLVLCPTVGCAVNRVRHILPNFTVFPKNICLCSKTTRYTSGNIVAHRQGCYGIAPLTSEHRVNSGPIRQCGLHNKARLGKRGRCQKVGIRVGRLERQCAVHADPRRQPAHELSFSTCPPLCFPFSLPPKRVTEDIWKVRSLPRSRDLVVRACACLPLDLTGCTASTVGISSHVTLLRGAAGKGRGVLEREGARYVARKVCHGGSRLLIVIGDRQVPEPRHCPSAAARKLVSFYSFTRRCLRSSKVVLQRPTFTSIPAINVIQASQTGKSGSMRRGFCSRSCAHVMTPARFTAINAPIRPEFSDGPVNTKCPRSIDQTRSLHYAAIGRMSPLQHCASCFNGNSEPTDFPVDPASN